MALIRIGECRLSCYRHMLCPQECLSGSGNNAEAQNPYRVWLARKVEKAVENALRYEGQKKMLDDYALSRKWAMPPIGEERRLVTMKIHSLLLQWKPDFSVQWGLKVRRSLPIVEITFCLMACCIEDYSQPLLIEPRLKKVLCLLESMPCQSQISQSSTQESLLNLFDKFHHLDLRFHSSSKHSNDVKGKACETCLLNSEGQGVESGKEACHHAGFDNGISGMMAHGPCNGASRHAHTDNLNEESMAVREQMAFSLCSFCRQSEEPLGRLNAKTQKACSCRSSMDELDSGNMDDSLEWSKANLQSRGTVATLMASELRSSRKEEANRALLNALALQDAQILEDNWNKHNEFASKWIVKKIRELLKSSSKRKEKDLGFKRVADKILHAAAEEKCPNAWVPSQIKRSTSKGLLGLLRISCHVPASAESALTFAEARSSNVLEASDMSTCCLLRMRSKHAGDQDEKSRVTQAKSPAPCLPSAVTTADDNSTYDEGTGNCHVNHDDVHPQHYENSEGSSGIASTCFSGEAEKPEIALVCHHGGDADTFVSHGCVDGQAESAHISPLIDGSDDTELRMVTCTHIEDGNATPANVDHSKKDPNVSSSDLGDTDIQDRPPLTTGLNERMVTSTHIEHGNATPANVDHSKTDPNVSSSDLGDNDIQDRPPLSTGLNERREDPLNCPQLYKELCMINVHNGQQGHPSAAQANMQTVLVFRDRERLEEPDPPINTVVTLEGNESQATAVCIQPAEGSRSRDEERREAVRRRVRVPLSRLLAETDEWSARNLNGSSSSRELAGNCAWDTWEEPSEALDPLCCVCMIGLRGAALTPCGHTFCRKCSRELRKARGTCPLCNKLITSILDIF